VDGLAAAQEQLQAQVQDLKTAQAGGADAGARLAKLEADLRRLETGLEPMRQDIVSSLSKRVADIMRGQGGGGGGTQTGREHVVKPGESLSRIAAAYGVKADAIVKANNLKSPGSLRVGQKLFIPE
jgi:LysM repeat protein